MFEEKRILGLDVSTKTGVSLTWVQPKGIGLVYEVKHKTEEVEFKKLRGMERVAKFHEWITGYVDEHKPDLAVIEGYGYANTNSLVTLVEVGTVMRLVCHHKSIPIVEVAPNMLKKFATGKGVAQKEQVMLSVYKRWGFDANTNNEADAFVLGRIGLMLVAGVEPTNQYERDIKKALGY